MEKGIKRAIYDYIGQIIMIVIFMIVSYVLFTSGKIQEFSKVAAAYDNMNINFMIAYDSNKEDNNAYKNLLDSGTLSIRNPNKKEVSAEVYMILTKSAPIDKMSVEFDGAVKEIKTCYIDNKSYDDAYMVKIKDIDMDAYEERYIETKLLGNPYDIKEFSYTFYIRENF